MAVVIAPARNFGALACDIVRPNVSVRVIRPTVLNATTHSVSVFARPFFRPFSRRMNFAMNRAARTRVVFLALVMLPLSSALSQVQDVGGRSEIFAGSDLERYLRYLQTLGLVGSYPWTIRDS